MMNWLQQWGKRNQLLSPNPNITLGRYSDAYKREENHKAWEAANQAFSKEDYVSSYRYFFQFLRDDIEENVKIEEKNGTIYFEFIQGSKCIFGSATQKKLTAIAKICKTEMLQVGYMRRLLEQNFSLKYCRYALDEDNVICIIFNTYSLDGSPYKLYQALKELAINADKQDDLLLDEFSECLRPIEQVYYISMPVEEQNVKYQFTIDSIEHTLQIIEKGKLPAEQFPGACSYLLLSLAYKLDFLIKPEGFMMETLERIHRSYFEKNEKTNIQKNKTLHSEYKKLLARTKEEYLKEFYRTKATFGITSPENHNRVASFIETEIHNMDWYKEHGHDEVALAITDYIIGFCLFNFAVLKPDKDLFTLYYKITNPSFFSALGFSVQYYDSKSNAFNKRAIRQAFSDLKQNYIIQYPYLQLDIRLLKFENLVTFAKSYLLMIKDLNLSTTNK